MAKRKGHQRQQSLKKFSSHVSSAQWCRQISKWEGGGTRWQNVPPKGHTGMKNWASLKKSWWYKVISSRRFGAGTFQRASGGVQRQSPVRFQKGISPEALGYHIICKWHCMDTKQTTEIKITILPNSDWPYTDSGVRVSACPTDLVMVCIGLHKTTHAPQ